MGVLGNTAQGSWELSEPPMTHLCTHGGLMGVSEQTPHGIFEKTPMKAALYCWRPHGSFLRHSPGLMGALKILPWGLPFTAPQGWSSSMWCVVVQVYQLCLPSGLLSKAHYASFSFFLFGYYSMLVTGISIPWSNFESEQTPPSIQDTLHLTYSTLHRVIVPP